MIDQQLIEWLLAGDIAIQYQTYRDLLNDNRVDLQERILQEGWGVDFMKVRNDFGRWGKSFYNPKWQSTHYTLLDIRYLCPPNDSPALSKIIEEVLDNGKSDDGGIDLSPSLTAPKSDVCVNGMFLNYASYFKATESQLESIVDFFIKEQMSDGGFNCRSNRSKCHHSSMHSTVAVIEGINSYLSNGYQYQKEKLISMRAECIEFLLMHKLFKSDKTDQIIHPEFLKLVYPGRWKYNILRGLEALADANIPYDPRLQEAIDVLIQKRNKDGTWNSQAKHPGKTHFEMEKAGKPSRWNTLRALKVLSTKYKVLR